MTTRLEVDYINSTVKLQKEDLSGTVNFSIVDITGDKVLTVPNTTDTLVCLNTQDTLTNKTLTAPVISTIVNNGTLTLPSGVTDTLVGKNTEDTLTNKTLTLPVISAIVNNGTLSLPSGVTDTLVGKNTEDTLTNKTLTAPVISTIVNNGTLTIPSGVNDTLVGKNTTDTLTNKTLTAPVISTIVNNNNILLLPTTADTLVGKNTTDTLTNKTLTNAKIETALLDINGSELMKVVATANAVNEITLINAASGAGPTINASGDSNANIDLNINPKGTGRIVLDGVKWPSLSNAGLANQVLMIDSPGSLSYAYADIFKVATGKTTDTNFQTIATISTETNYTYFIESYIVGIYENGTKSVAYRMNSIYRTDATTLTKINGNDNKTSFEEGGATACDVQTLQSASNIIIQVKGAVPNVIWKASYKVLSVRTTETPTPPTLP
jgi:hypothetical protein